MPIPLMAAGAIAARVAPWLLTLAPVITGLFSKSEEPAPEELAKVKEARDGMAARLSAAEGISMERALAAVNEQLKPMIDQASKAHEGGGNLAADVAGMAGAAMLGRRSGIAKVEKGLTGMASDVRKPLANPAEGMTSDLSMIPGRTSRVPARPAPPETYRGAVSEVEPGDQGEGLGVDEMEALKRAAMRSRMGTMAFPGAA